MPPIQQVLAASSPIEWSLRLARETDATAMADLIPRSVRRLQASYYTPAQIAAALGSVFDVDRQLIRDSTYFVVERDGLLVGCGGWSRRGSLYGGDAGRIEEDRLLDPQKDAARVRAFFVHPDWVRQGIGRRILKACEQAIIKAGFRSIEMVATLAGEPFYLKFDYTVEERFVMELGGGLELPVVRMGKRIAN